MPAQGIKDFIPTTLKNSIHQPVATVGFETIDFGSFVSPKPFHKMRDTLKCWEDLTWAAAIVSCHGHYCQRIAVRRTPASLKRSATWFSFQFQKHFNNAIQIQVSESFERVKEIQTLAGFTTKNCWYISMVWKSLWRSVASRNCHWIKKKKKKKKTRELGIEHRLWPTTVGSSSTETLTSCSEFCCPELKGINFGAHLHSTPDKRIEKISAA